VTLNFRVKAGIAIVHCCETSLSVVLRREHVLLNVLVCCQNNKDLNTVGVGFSWFTIVVSVLGTAQYSDLFPRGFPAPKIHFPAGIFPSKPREMKWDRPSDNINLIYI